MSTLHGCLWGVEPGPADFYQIFKTNQKRCLITTFHATVRCTRIASTRFCCLERDQFFRNCQFQTSTRTKNFDTHMIKKSTNSRQHTPSILLDRQAAERKSMKIWNILLDQRYCATTAIKRLYHGQISCMYNLSDCFDSCKLKSKYDTKHRWMKSWVHWRITGTQRLSHSFNILSGKLTTHKKTRIKWKIHLHT